MQGSMVCTFDLLFLAGYIREAYPLRITSCSATAQGGFPDAAQSSRIQLQAQQEWRSLEVPKACLKIWTGLLFLQKVFQEWNVANWWQAVSNQPGNQSMLNLCQAFTICMTKGVTAQQHRSPAQLPVPQKAQGLKALIKAD